MFHKIFCYTFKYIQIFFISCFRIRNRTAVYSPSLTSRPSRAVTIPLTSNTLCRFTCFHIKEICMICRIIVTHDIFHRCFYMCLCFFFILFITCHLARPEKQRHIHKTIYYKSVIVLIAYFAPRLKELTFFVKTFHQTLCPVCIFCLPVKIIFTVCTRKTVKKLVNIMFNKRNRLIVCVTNFFIISHRIAL